MISTIITALITLIILEHIFIVFMEMIIPTSSFTQRVFKIDLGMIKHPQYKVMMQNQGLYNLFLLVGLILSFCVDPHFSRILQIFFLSCISVAGIFGAITSQISILFKQGMPAIITLILVLCFR